MPGEANLEAKVTVKIDTRAARRELDELDRKSRRSDQSQRNEQRATEDLRRERGERKGAFDRMLLNGSFLLITVASAVICGVPLLSHFAQIIVEWWSQYAR